MNEQERVSRGLRAKQLIEDELFADAVQQLKNEFMLAWEKTPIADSEQREELYKMHKIVDAVVGNIYRVMHDGKLADEEIKYNEGIDEKGNIR